jgi:hypothetical protein
MRLVGYLKRKPVLGILVCQNNIDFTCSKTRCLITYTFFLFLFIPSSSYILLFITSFFKGHFYYVRLSLHCPNTQDTCPYSEMRTFRFYF